MKEFKSGFVAILGRPNSGKSTLLNRFVGEKISIVTPKPQTTRNKIAGILTTEDYQIIFEDTPGIFNGKDELSKFMQKSWEFARKNTDIIIYLIDGEKGFNKADFNIIDKFTEKDTVIFAVNKTDAADPALIFPILQELNKYQFAKDIIPISAKTGENCDVLLDRIVSLLKTGQKYYDDDAITDKTERFMVSEIIREKILLYFNQEVPHGVGVAVNKFETMDNGVYHIDCDIVADKASHKSIIIGKGGLALKNIAEKSRKDIEKVLDNKVYLTLWVKVKENWKENTSVLNDIGYNKKDL